MVRIALFLTGLLLVVPVGVLAQEPGLGPGDPMPGSDLPLQDRGGRSVTLSALRGERATVVLFWSNTCPWTRAYRDRLERLARSEEGHGVVFVFVNANDAEAFPHEATEAARRAAPPERPNVHYVRDGRSALARAFGARRTPEVFVFDATGRLVYTGAIDDNPRSEDEVEQPYLAEVLTALRQGTAPPVTRTDPYGCLIKFVKP